jgi:hypothetical protein
MGIIKSKHVAADQAASAAPEFEQEEGQGAEVAQEVVKTVTRADVQKDEPKVVEKQPEVAAVKDEVVAKQEAPAKSTAVIARTEGGALKTMFSSSKNFVNPLADLKDAFAKNGIDVTYKTFPRLRVDSGHIASAEGKDAGEFIEIQVVSYGPTWNVAPGSDDEASKKLVRFSDDGKTIKAAGDDDEWSGKTVEEYKDHLRSLGFENASVKEYTMLYGIALDAEEAGFEHMNEIVALQLAPQSKDKFNSYVMNRGIAARMGRIVETSGHPVVRFTTERAKNANGKSYFNVIPSHGKTAPVDLG